MFRAFMVTLISSLALASPTWAAGSSSKSSPGPASAFGVAEKAVKAANYAKAIPLLQKIVAKSPDNADAWNYLAFSHRKQGRMELALGEYMKALAIDPNHRGANEYLGELYVQTGRMELAKERLAKLDDLCTFGCDEYDDLKAAIKAKGG